MKLPDLENMKKYVPEELNVYGIVVAVIPALVYMKSRRYKRQVHSNNWLKMHGYSMRRKGRKGSKKS